MLRLPVHKAPTPKNMGYKAECIELEEHVNMLMFQNFKKLSRLLSILRTTKVNFPLF